MPLTDRDHFDGSIGDTNSETVTISGSQTDRAHLLVDDGTTDNNPSEYTITVRAYNPDIDRYQFVWQETTRTDRSWSFDSPGANAEVEITNTSGSSANYEMMLEGYTNGN